MHRQKRVVVGINHYPKWPQEMFRRSKFNCNVDAWPNTQCSKQDGLPAKMAYNELSVHYAPCIII